MPVFTIKKLEVPPLFVHNHRIVIVFHFFLTLVPGTLDWEICITLSRLPTINQWRCNGPPCHLSPPRILHDGASIRALGNDCRTPVVCPGASCATAGLRQRCSADSASQL